MEGLYWVTQDINESDEGDDDTDSDGNDVSYLDKVLVVVGDDGDAEMAVLSEQRGPLNLGAHSVR